MAAKRPAIQARQGHPSGLGDDAAKLILKGVRAVAKKVTGKPVPKRTVVKPKTVPPKSKFPNGMTADQYRTYLKVADEMTEKFYKRNPKGVLTGEDFSRIGRAATNVAKTKVVPSRTIYPKPPKRK